MTFDNINKDWVVVGKIQKTYGTKGLVKIISYCDKPNSIFNYEPIILENTKERVYLNLNDKKNNITDKKIFIAKISTSKSIEESKNLIGEVLLANKKKFNACKKDDFFYSDLEKCNVLDLNNQLIGKISGIFNFGAGDILEITKYEDNSSILINFSKKNFPKISIKEKSIILKVT